MESIGLGYWVPISFRVMEKQGPLFCQGYYIHIENLTGRVIMPNWSEIRWSNVSLLAALVLALGVGGQPAFSQTTISTGGIVGTVTDASSALVPNAKITITNK